jgi:hypothetical protein
MVLTLLANKRRYKRNRNLDDTVDEAEKETGEEERPSPIPSFSLGWRVCVFESITTDVRLLKII